MEFAEIKKAIIDYATEVDTASKAVKTHFTAIANAQHDMTNLETKWVNGAENIETAINAISDASVKASYAGQLALLRTQRTELVAMLTALDSAVTSAGLMLI